MKRIALMTGGNSGEYEISLKTADNIYQMLDKNLYEPYLIHLKGNNWTYTAPDGEVVEVNRNDFSLDLKGKKITFDAVFIAIHGNPGENGRLEAYFDMIGMPYTGCGMLSSALTFNKYYCNVVVKNLGIPVAPSLHYFKGETVDPKKVAEVCGYPCFVKSCNSGSSVGVTKVHVEEELAAAVEEAFKYDSQLVIEKMIVGREVTCGVGRIKGTVRAFAVTEIVSMREFYDYKSKYTDGQHDLITPADLPDNIRDTIFRYSEMLFRELACGGIVRADFIVTPEGVPYFLEVNTIPGQTAMSIVPNQIRYIGMNLTDVYSDLIEQSFNQL
ncbi:MAG: D-alanine--D-alanine ligase [Bacteroidales bacterium]|nr:D-alanine--D-alanine ligase [Bacteroidales bacterium]